MLRVVKCYHPTNHYFRMIILLKFHHNPIKSHEVTINPTDIPIPPEAWCGVATSGDGIGAEAASHSGLPHQEFH